jgi:hypothetical protein
MDDEVSLRDYLEARFVEHEKAHAQLALALRVALDSMDKRLDGMNEFRNSLNDVTTRAVSRELFDQRVSATDERLKLLERDRATFITDDKFDIRAETVNQRLGAMENWRSKATGAAVVLSVLAGTLGAIIIRAIFGN